MPSSKRRLSRLHDRLKIRPLQPNNLRAAASRRTHFGLNRHLGAREACGRVHPEEPDVEERQLCPQAALIR